MSESKRASISDHTGDDSGASAGVKMQRTTSVHHKKRQVDLRDTTLQALVAKVQSMASQVHSLKTIVAEDRIERTSLPMSITRTLVDNVRDTLSRRGGIRVVHCMTTWYTFAKCKCVHVLSLRWRPYRKTS